MLKATCCLGKVQLPALIQPLHIVELAVASPPCPILPVNTAAEAPTKPANNPVRAIFLKNSLLPIMAYKFLELFVKNRINPLSKSKRYMLSSPSTAIAGAFVPCSKLPGAATIVTNSPDTW